MIALKKMIRFLFNVKKGKKMVSISGRYPVAVRDKDSTKALYWYYVDIETGTFDVR